NYDINDFFAALKADNLPAVSFLKAPAFQDGHAGYSDPLNEQNFLVHVINPCKTFADPSDSACVRAAEIVLSGVVAVDVASFEDIATALTEKIGADEAAPSATETNAPRAHAEDDLDSLRDLASGAPVVRAVNDFLEKAMELRASDIHIEPFRS